MSGRNILWVAALLLCQACGHSGAASQEPTDAGLKGEEPTIALDGSSIVFYNVENLFDTEDDPRTNDADFLPTGKLNWTEERYTHKLRQLAKAIKWTGQELPVLIGLCEVENARVVHDLAGTAQLAAIGYVVLHFDSPDERGIDVALLVDPTRARLLHAEALPIALDDDVTRDVLHAQLDVLGPADLHVFVNHWSSRHGGKEASEPKRMAAANMVRAQVDALLEQDPDAQILIMGDLNDGPTDRSVQQGLRASCSSRERADLFALMCMDQPAGHGSYHYQGEWNYLDQFVVSRSLLERTESAKALWDKRLLFRHPEHGQSPDRSYSGGHYKGGFSDHLPVVLRLK
jgi:endonuclease/exonuclease/phosphatase family metal-dependent hydrolase